MLLSVADEVIAPVAVEDDALMVDEAVAGASDMGAVVDAEAVEVPVCGSATSVPRSLASVASRLCSCWRSDAMASLDETAGALPSVVEATSVAEPASVCDGSLDEELPVVWICDRTERKLATAGDGPLASTLDPLDSDPDVAGPVLAVGSSVLAVDVADEALWARAAW